MNGPYPDRETIVQGRIAAPFDALIWRELARALAFEEKNALMKSIMVIVAAGRHWTEKEE